MNKSELEKLYENFLLLPFPEGKTHQDDWMDWITELAEIDTFYAGSAATLLTDKPLKNNNFPSLEKLFTEFKKFKHQPGISQQSYYDGEQYLLALDLLAKGIKSFNK
ncbi:MAG: hypothetical protein H0V82_00895 [Candidatus Protochlamydia sp.]|nr:hypothetical protein [Candidatus Protochlamydia sp.]